MKKWEYENKKSISMKSDSIKTLIAGDRIQLSGGYDMDPLYLKDPPSGNRTGQVLKFIKGQNETQAAVVKLDYQIKGEKVTGDIMILEPRYVGQNWQDDGLGPVHIELCDFIPDDIEWKNRRKGEWIEAAASWKII